MADKGSLWKKVVLVVIFIVIILMTMIFFFVGFKGLLEFFKWLMIGAMVLMMLFGLLYVFYLVFLKKEYKDIPASFRKKLQATSKIMKQEMLGDLYLSGDLKHNRMNLGRFRYMRIMLPRQQKKIKEDKKGNPILDKFDKPIYIEQTHGIPVDCFIVAKKGLMAYFFDEPKLILVKPKDHDYSSIFNDVTVRGFNLVPLDSQFYTVDHRNLDTDITKGLTTNYMREVVYEILTDLDHLVKSSMKLDAEHQKQKEKALEFDIPMMGNNNQGGGQQ